MSRIQVLRHSLFPGLPCIRGRGYGCLSCGISLGLAGAGVSDGEAAVGRGDNLEIRTVCAVFEIGDEIVGAVVRGIGIFGGMQHPEIFEAGTFMHGLPGFRTAGLVRAVVHDGYAGMDGVDEGFGVGEIKAVVVDEIEVDGADQIVGADEGDFLGFG